MNCVKSTSVSNEVTCAVTAGDGVYDVGDDTVTCITNPYSGIYYFWQSGLSGWVDYYITGTISGDNLSWNDDGFGIIFERYEVGKT